MCSACRLAWVLLLGAIANAEELRVCADPNNLPYSNLAERGFENHIAKVVAADLNRPLRFVWAPQRGRYIRNVVKPGLCDLVMGVAQGFDRLETTKPYYRSSYVFVVRSNAAYRPASFDDPRLAAAKVGVHVMPDDGAIAPPAQVLYERGAGRNIVWYRLFPDFSQPDPPSALIEGVRKGDVDVAIAWGPLAGYFARQRQPLLQIVPIPHQKERSIPLAFNICMGARRPNHALVQQLNTIIDRRQRVIHNILKSYGVPLIPITKE